MEQPVNPWQRRDYRAIDVPVRGGLLRTGVWGPGSGPQGQAVPTILAIHGVTASHLAWGLLADELPGVRIVAPDLRGRGRSNRLPGPFGMASHADDLAAVLAAGDVGAGGGPVVVAGHSMGAFAALVFAHRHPALVRRLVLVDGGLPLQVPAGLSADEVVAAVLGPAAERLSRVFPSRRDYRLFWREHPAFERNWNPLVEAYVDYDLDGQGQRLQPSTSYQAVAEDTADLNGGAVLLAALAGLSVPAVLLRSPRGLLDEPQGLYQPEYVRQWTDRTALLSARDVPGTNHYSIVMDHPGVQAVAGAVREALEPQLSQPAGC
ncbi:alpha/beta hydrolase [Arthrobacter sp. I2-34]|uniref:Alpha/beta hydrolase n=1 Tax=Arthrobacter hankyongi TaxID=2904801 RepID=A0ABS9L7N0_9MICC|nr:alpha/beta hydrolase [Arthrobacter hankyongi]MCG2622669.1 alpha/beta hydrolase [Arthrobacter hankyongi]